MRLPTPEIFPRDGKGGSGHSERSEKPKLLSKQPHPSDFRDGHTCDSLFVIPRAATYVIGVSRLPAVWLLLDF